MLAGSGALLAAGVLLAYREMIVLGVAGLAAFALGAAWGLTPPPVVVDRVVEPRRVRRDEPASTTVDLIVPGRARRVLRVADVIAAENGPPAPVGQVETATRPGFPARVTFALPTDRRGAFHIGPMHVGRDDPLGLWAVMRPAGAPQPFTVWPRWHAVSRAAAGRSAEIEGERELVDAGSITFHALREYAPGDDLRHIHWRTSARAGTLMVRTHVDAAVARLAVVLDDRAESYPDADGFEHAVEVAASLVVATTDDGRRITLLTARDPARDRPVGSAAEGLDLLAAVTLGPGQDAESGAELAARLRLRPGGDALVVITGGPGAGRLHALATLGSRYRATTVAIVGPEPEKSSDVDRHAVVAPTAAQLVARLQDRLWTDSSAR